MADWEPGYALAELNTGRFFKDPAQKYTIKTVALTKDSIITMGGLHILPDITVDEIRPEDAALLILPGGETWLEPQHAPILRITEQFLDEGIYTAAICGATYALAQAGMLDTRTHTSNNLQSLKSTCPNYQGEQYYRNEPSVTDENLITASGIAPVEFAYNILQCLDVFSDDTLQAWYDLFRTRKEQYFYALMQSLPQAE